MKHGTDRRLMALETIWQRPSTATPGDAFFLKWWSRPTFYGVLAECCDERARLRFYHDGGERYAWYRLPATERHALADREYDDLMALDEALGGEEGWNAWHEQARHWTPDFSAEPPNAAAFERQLRHEWGVADENRAQNGIFAHAWPEWKRGMTAAESLAFDEVLLTDGARVDRVLAALGVSADAAIGGTTWMR